MSPIFKLLFILCFLYNFGTFGFSLVFTFATWKSLFLFILPPFGVSLLFYVTLFIVYFVIRRVI